MCVLKISPSWMQFFFIFVYCSTSGCQGQCCDVTAVLAWRTHRPTLGPGCVAHGMGSEPERHKRLSVSKKAKELLSGAMNGTQVRPQKWGYSCGSSRRKKICQQKSRKWRKCLCTVAEPLRAWLLVSAGFEAFAKSIKLLLSKAKLMIKLRGCCCYFSESFDLPRNVYELVWESCFHFTNLFF